MMRGDAALVRGQRGKKYNCKQKERQQQNIFTCVVGNTLCRSAGGGTNGRGE